MFKKKSKKLFSIFLIILSTTSLVFILLFSSFLGLIYDVGFYNKLYEETGTYDRISNIIVDNKTYEIMNFFTDSDELDESFFTKNEIDHMNDVKWLIDIILELYYVLMIFIFLLLIVSFKHDKNNFSKFVKKTLLYSGIAAVIMVILFYFSSFTVIFDNFHKIFFIENYSFPSTSNLIRLFNMDFFYLFAERIFLIFFIKGIVLGVLGFIFYTYYTTSLFDW